MSSSAAFQIDVGSGYGATNTAQDAAASTTITCKLVSVADINPGLISWSIFGTHGIAAPALTTGGSPDGQTVEFDTVAGDGQAYGIRCDVNGGEAVTGRGEDTQTSAVYVLNGSGLRPFFIGEMLEADADYGPVPRLNALNAGFGLQEYLARKVFL